jgi:hypothetical protein
VNQFVFFLLLVDHEPFVLISNLLLHFYYLILFVYQLMMFVIVQLEQLFHEFYQDQLLNVDEFLQFPFVFLQLF